MAKASDSTDAYDKKRSQALDRALQQIERAYGKGAIMQMDGDFSPSRDAIHLRDRVELHSPAGVRPQLDEADGARSVGLGQFDAQRVILRLDEAGSTTRAEA